MTSRSEFRLLLRQDNADSRLTPHGYSVGLISEERYQKFLDKQEKIATEKERLEHTHLSPDRANAFLEAHGCERISSGASLADLLRRPQLSYAELAELDPTRPSLPEPVKKTVEIDVKYAGYIKRELAEVQRQKKLEEKRLPEGINYAEMQGLRLEARQKLEKIRPLTVGQAARISGVSPADISVLLLCLGMK